MFGKIEHIGIAVSNLETANSLYEQLLGVAPYKQESVEKINDLVSKALEKKKPRIASKVSKAAKEKRLEWKKRNADIKMGRQKLKPGSY